MTYQEALKKIQTSKPKDNFMVIEASYNNKIILPYKDGVVFLTTLNNAESLVESYGDPTRINYFSRDAITSRVMSSQEYEQIKIANLLNISVDDVKAMALEGTQ